MSLFKAHGDATEVINKPTVIMHVCNNAGGWGRGFVLALSAKWPEPEASYREWAAQKWWRDFNDEKIIHFFKLGQVQFVKVEDGVWVANIVAQTLENKSRNLNYEALYEGIEQVRNFAMLNDAAVQCPMLGSALAGGDWRIVEAMLQHFFGDKGNPNCTWFEFSPKKN